MYLLFREKLTEHILCLFWNQDFSYFLKGDSNSHL